MTRALTRQRASIRYVAQEPEQLIRTKLNTVKYEKERPVPISLREKPTCYGCGLPFTNVQARDTHQKTCNDFIKAISG